MPADIAKMLADPDFKALPVDMQGELIQRVTGAAMPQPPPESTATKAASLAYRAGKALPSFAREAAPTAAAIGATIAEPLASPITAPLAYASTEGLLNPKEIQQHPIGEGISAATWALPGPLEAARWAAPEIVAKNPLAVKLGGAALGGVVGASLGEQSGYGRYGEMGGAGIGLLGGWRAGSGAVKDAGEKLIGDVLEGKRAESVLPFNLAGKFQKEQFDTANMGVRKALATGAGLNLSEIPESARPLAQQMFRQAAEKQALAKQKQMISVGGELAENETNKLINDVINRDKPLSQLPSNLFPRYMSELTARANAYLELAAQQGRDIDKVNVPTSVRQMAEQIREERMKQFAKMPPMIQTPEQIQAAEGRARAFGAVKGELAPEAQARGMAHAAGQHEGEWVPSKRATRISTTGTSKPFPKVK